MFHGKIDKQIAKGLVELRDDLTDLGRVIKILGPYWHAVYSNIIPDAGGNRERIGFIFDKRAVPSVTMTRNHRSRSAKCALLRVAQPSALESSASQYAARRGRASDI